MLASILQVISIGLLAAVACAVLMEIARIGRQLLADRRMDRIRIRQWIEEVELRQRDVRRNLAAPETAPQHDPHVDLPASENDIELPSDRSNGSTAKRTSGHVTTPKPQAPPPAWQGTRPFRIAQKMVECEGCQSIYLVPVDGQPLPLYLPGQFLTWNVKIPGQGKPTVRCYSLSDEPNQEFYRCTIKKIAPDPTRPNSLPGVMSSYLHDEIQPGTIVDIGAPRGGFFLDVFSERPVVLIAAGIGITPMLSMLNTLIHTGFAQPIYLFFGVRNGAEHPFRKHLGKLALQHAHVLITTAYSQPSPQDQLSRDYQLLGRIDIETVKQTVKTTDAEFYICGPGSFMQSMVTGLTNWGVGEQHIRFEAFGPSSVRVKEKRDPSKAATKFGGTPSGNTTIQFARSGQTHSWNRNSESLLEFAEEIGIEIESGCRSGNCGTCATAIKSGSVNYHDHADPACDAGHCLPCVCTPAESLILDA